MKSLALNSQSMDLISLWWWRQSTNSHHLVHSTWPSILNQSLVSLSLLTSLHLRNDTKLLNLKIEALSSFNRFQVIPLLSCLQSYSLVQSSFDLMECSGLQLLDSQSCKHLYSISTMRLLARVAFPCLCYLILYSGVSLTLLLY
jgi:hypothetical protein